MTGIRVLIQYGLTCSCWNTKQLVHFSRLNVSWALGLITCDEITWPDKGRQQKLTLLHLLSTCFPYGLVIDLLVDVVLTPLWIMQTTRHGARDCYLCPLVHPPPHTLMHVVQPNNSDSGKLSKVSSVLSIWIYIIIVTKNVMYYRWVPRKIWFRRVIYLYKSKWF